MKLYISVFVHARKLKFSIYVHLPPTNKRLQHSHACVILCNVQEVYIFNHKLYISALEHFRMLILSSYVHLECINTIHKYDEAREIWFDLVNFRVSLCISGLGLARKSLFGMFIPNQDIYTNYQYFNLE